jgi:uncharacterized membrane protein YeaQ/YmgE (transglycosylase-associated protein family)
VTIEEILVLILLAAALGVYCQRLLGYKLGGLVVSIILGFVGGFLGSLIGHRYGPPLGIRFNVELGDAKFPVVWTLFGALVATFVAGLIARSAGKQKKKKE